MILLLGFMLMFNVQAKGLEIHTIKGAKKGPVLLVVGGIHGDEPSGPKAVDLFKDVKVEEGTLILVPRANVRALSRNKRYLNRDMNRMFGEKTCSRCYELGPVKELKKLISSADMFLNLHEGTGFFLKDPKKYGQSIVVDDASLMPAAAYVVQELNKSINDKELKFGLNFQDTSSNKTKFPEQKGSATYYSFYEKGIPAFGVEVSKDIQDQRKKVAMHCSAISAFAKKLGVKIAKTGDKVQPECNIN